MKLKLIALTRLIALTTAMIMASVVVASAKTVVFENKQQIKGQAVVAVYDKTNMLKSCEFVSIAEDGTSFNMDYDKYTSDDVIKLYSMDLKSSMVVTPLDSPKPTATPTASPTPTTKPTTAPATTYPPVYEKGVDAVLAPAMVTKVSMTLDKNSERQYEIEIYYQGRERTLFMPEDTKIANAPAQYIGLIGSSVNSLKEGDVIVFSSRLSGRLNDISLVYRPQKEDIINDTTDFGSSFEELFSRNGTIGTEKSNTVYKYDRTNTARIQYAFGVVQDKRGNSFVLNNKSGKVDTQADMYIPDNAMVYVYDMSTNESYMGNISDIEKSEISRQDMDDMDNIINWTQDGVRNYVLARVVDDVVTDAIVYLNYND